jgi:sirohydrochlorin cobaltochelatase
MVVFVAHGSRDPRWRASVEEVVESIQAALGPDRARLAYMDCAPPTLLDVASEAIGLGVEKIQVLPLFLAPEGHVDRDIRPLVDEVARAHPSLQVTLLPPMGQHPLFRDFLYHVSRKTDEGA